MDLRVSWRRRYSSYVALYLGRSVPILVYQMGKGGSSTLRNTLLLRELHPVLHLHTLSPLREKRAEDVDVPDELEAPLFLAQLPQAVVQAHQHFLQLWNLLCHIRIARLLPAEVPQALL